jgi:molybdate transport system substrate-binding protein
LCAAAAACAVLLFATMGWSQATGQAASQPVELRIAAAADLQPVMPVLAQEYEKETGVKLAVSDGKEPLPYAKGTLVLWGRKGLAAPLSMELLEDPRITRVAIADEFHAPYGRAAYAALRWLKVFDQVKDKLVVGENIAQTAQFVESGNAQLGFISLTLASTEKFKAEGQYVMVPKVYPEIQQNVVVMKASPHLAEAKAFVAWVRSPKVQENLSKFGLEAVQ